MEKKSERDSCGSETQIVEDQPRPSFVQVITGCLKSSKEEHTIHVFHIIAQVIAKLAEKS